MDPWKVASDERAKHDAQFSTLTQGTHITGEQARGFFMQSNLPQMVLGQIWGMADLTSDGLMDRKEFSIAMTLIKRQLHGYPLPSALPPSMLIEPSLGGTLPHGMTGLPSTMPAMSSATLPNRLPGQSVNLSLGAAPASPARSADGTTEWAVPHASRLKYNQLFNREDRRHVGFLTGLDARQLLMSTGLPQNLLAQIWSLADVDADGRLSSEEFSLAMFLADMVRMGQPLPMTLPPNFIPPSMRPRSRSNSAAQLASVTAAASRPSDSFGDLIPGGFGSALMPQAAEPQQQEEAPSLTPLTLEDKRRENFAKGNAELEKRRAELREQQRKEEEARLAKEKSEQDKRDAIKREQERKRLAEQERLMERQRQIEAEREEQRRKALEARESARKEMERQRQQEWERQRKQSLLVEKKRHQEAVQLLESQVNNLKYEIETMDNKKNELVARIADGKDNVIKNTRFIDDMRLTRDSLMAAVSSHQSSKGEQERLYHSLTSEWSQVNQALQTRQAANPVSDNFKQHQNLHATKKQQVETLRQSLNDLNSNKSTLNADVNETRNTMAKLKESISQLQRTQTESRDRVQAKKSDWENEKRRRADEKIRAERELRQKEEAEKAQRIEDEKKKKEEDKWSVFKDLDIGAPSATTTVPGNQATFSNDWFTNTTDKPSDQQTAGQWGSTTAQSNGSADFFADSSWGNSATSSEGAWNEPVKPSNDVWGTNDMNSASVAKSSDGWGAATNSSASTNSSGLFGGASDSFSTSKPKTTPIIQPPPKTPTKKETTFGVFSAAKSKEATPRAAAVVQPEATSKTRKVEIYQVQFDFQGRNADELNLVEDEKVKVYPDEQESAEPGWLSGWKGDVAGIFPANYVIKVRDVYEPVSSNASAKKPNTTNEVTSGMSRSESAFDEVRASPPLEGGKPAPEGLTCIALYQWRAKKDNHLSFNEGDEIKVLMQQDMWWQGSLADGQEGWFPKNYVKTFEKPPAAIQKPSPEAPVIDSSRYYDQVPAAEASPAATARAYHEPPDTNSSRYYDQVPHSNKATSDATPSQSERYLALHEYQSAVPGDLSFSAGELIIVTNKDGEWWTGSVGNRSGIFPASYVGTGDQDTAKLQDVQTNNAPSLPNRHPTSNVDSQAIATNRPSVVKKHPRAAPRTPLHIPSSKFIKPASPASSPSPGASSSSSSQTKEIGRVIAAYEASGQEQLSLKPNQLIQIKKKSASGWWEGELVAKGQKKQIGWFPKDYVKLLPTAGSKIGERSSTPAAELMDSPRAQEAAPAATPVQAAVEPAPAFATAAAPVITHGKVQASYPYTAQNEDELSFQQGDVIAVVNKDDPDWWTGQVNGLTGVFPSNYVQHYTEPLSEDEKKRQQAIAELIDTEETYVNDMVVAVEAFYNPLQECKNIPESELEAIFVNWTELIHCNRKLVNAFKVRQNTCGRDEPINVIGDILVENFPNMTPYIRFCSRQLHAAQLLQRRVETDTEARQFIGKCQQDERVQGMPLSSYILKPMQRITKYPLLVKRIMTHTSQDHPDYQYISEASAKAQELANQVNEGVREKDNSDKLEWVQNHVSCDGLTEHITFNSLTNALGQRKFIYSGILSKLRSGRELYVFLFNDFLLFTTPVSGTAAEKVFHLDAKGILFKMYKTPVFLNEVTVREPINLEKPDTENVCFQICHIENVIDIKCSTTTERNAWLKRLAIATEAALSMERVKRERAQSQHASPIKQGIGRLLVILMEGRSLLASDANVKLPPLGRLVLVLREAVDIVGVKPSTGKSDPYCEVTMGSIIHKTKVIPNTLNPKWNSNMQFPIKSVEDDVLCFTVFDQDRFSPNDFLGRTELRVKDILKETREKRGPILKYARLQEVNTGDIVVKLDLQLYRSLTPVPGQRLLR